MTTGVLSLETQIRSSVWVATSRPHSGGGSEVFAIVLRFDDITNKVSNCFIRLCRVGPWGQNHRICIQLFGLRNQWTMNTNKNGLSLGRSLRRQDLTVLLFNVARLCG